MSTLTRTIELTTTSCARCHVVFAIPTSWDESLRETHATFYCPAGHSLSYPGKSEAEKLRDDLARAERRRKTLTAQLTSTQDQLGATERSLRGHKAAKTRIKNRIAAGVCPCCNRSFQNVARHMAGQHPEFPADD